MEQFDNLIEFRQATYEHGFTKACDAQFELVDALLLGRSARYRSAFGILPYLAEPSDCFDVARQKGPQGSVGPRFESTGEQEKRPGAQSGWAMG